MSASQRIYQRVWHRAWIPRRLACFMYKRLARAGNAPDCAFEIDFFGVRYQGNLRNNIDFNIYFYGAFEKPLLFFLRDTQRALATAEVVFIDIGANVGQHSLFMAAHGASVHAFEPFSTVRDQLVTQIEANGLSNITVHPLGLGNRNTHQAFFAPTGSNMGIGSFDANTLSKGNIAAGELELAKGDDFFRDHDIDKIDLVKIDVEGFEKLTLEGLRESLQGQRPVIVCEITYGIALSMTSVRELQQLLPDDYLLFTFDTRKGDGSKARRRERHNRESGQYRIIPFTDWRVNGQDDVIACPLEKVDLLPRQSER